MKARVTVTLKAGVLDPQGKVFDIEIDAVDADAVKGRLTQACEKLLANTIVEDYAISHD